MTKVYLSGPIQGIPFPKAQLAFATAACEVADRLDDTLDIIDPTKLPTTCSCWADYLIRDLMVLKGCDVIAMLPNWQSSPGARTEHEFAVGCGIKVMELGSGKEGE